MPNINLTSDSFVAVQSPVVSGSIFAALTMKCNVKRRAGNPVKDILNAPNYGKVDNWVNIYINLPCRLEIKQSSIQFKPTGERVEPTNILYVDASTPLNIEDRVFMVSSDNVSGLGYQQEFIVSGVMPAISMIGGIDHYEYSLIIP
jgi:hypothetical protein